MQNTRKTISLVPFPALGDATIFLRLAQAFSESHFNVEIFSDLLLSSKNLFDWISIKETNSDPSQILAYCELLIVDIHSPFFITNKKLLENNPKVLLTTAKDFTIRKNALKDCSLRFLGKDLKIAHGPICEDSKSGKSMIECVDNFVFTKFGLNPPCQTPKVSIKIKLSNDLKKHVAIFPTTPNPKKNYSTSGFKKLAYLLQKKEWKVTIVCTPDEKSLLAAQYPPFEVKSFPSIKELIEFLASTNLVISNDSGGGHLASMLGIPTITITRKSENFLWRPGYANNIVISPNIKFKFFSGHIWRPFISIRKIINATESLLVSSKSKTPLL